MNGQKYRKPKQISVVLHRPLAIILIYAVRFSAFPESFSHSPHHWPERVWAFPGELWETVSSWY